MMIPISVEAFREEIQSLARRNFPDSEWEVHEQNPFRLKARVLLSPGLFIEVFYSPRTRRISFALLKGTKRIFGIDNLNGWHRHPFGEVERHQPIREPSLQEIFMEIKDIVVSQGLLQK